MTLGSGTRLGPYEILAPLGAGGMGEVYLARDLRLDRQVAIKALPAHLANDPDRLARFEREAKIVASLSHSGIGAVYALEEQDGQKYLVMEYVEGQTLTAILASGPMHVDEAVTHAVQIAEALEAAHDKGVIHRDLKPSNIMITPGGKAKILDFGLARSAEAEPFGSSMTSADSPTLTTPAHSPTIPGVVMGSAGYMSPEQARGRAVDKRSDIFSFGCIVYEMLTGARPFYGETVADALGATLHKEIDLSLLPAHTPPGVRRVLARCLVKDRNKRLHDIADARIELQSQGEEADPVNSNGPVTSRGWPVLAAFVFGAVLVASAFWFLNRPAPPKAQPVTRFTLSDLGMPVDAFQSLALSPDGRHLAFRAIGEDGLERIHLRSFDSLEVKKLTEGVVGGWYPFFSPDGDRVGFYTRGVLKQVSLSSNMAKTIALVDQGGFSGATWLPDDTIITAGSNRQFNRVRSSGGELEALEVKGLPEGHFVVSPWALPGGSALLCGVSDGSAFNIAVYDLASHSLKTIAENGFNPTYVESGHILYQGGQNSLMALAFDVRQGRVTSDPFTVLEDLGRRSSYQCRMFTASSDGTIAYIRKSGAFDKGALMWVDRQGQSSAIVELENVADLPRISPDGRRIAFRVAGPNCDIWVHDIERGATTRLTREGDNHGIAWFGDGNRIAFARLGAPALWEILSAAADGAGDTEKITAPAISRGFVSSVSPDGQFVLVGSGTSTGDDVYLVNARDKTVKPLLQSRFSERSAVFSPDGRYVAFSSDESGRDEVYVQPFPALDRREQVSTAGGEQPVWSRDGKELFFRWNRKMMAVEVTLQPTFTAGRPRPLFENDLSARSNSGLGPYDVSPDGQRFVMVRSRSAEGGAEVNVILNWSEELKRLGAAGPK